MYEFISSFPLLEGFLSLTSKELIASISEKNLSVITIFFFEHVRLSHPLIWKKASYCNNKQKTVKENLSNLV